MRANTLVRTAVVGIAALAASVTSVRAFCASAVETYAIFQCTQFAYFEPVPSPFTPSQVTGVFWQLGFGNKGTTPPGVPSAQDTGLGNDGTGFASKAFNGNDSGYFPVDILNAAVRFPTFGFPPGSVCLGSNNWSNSGVDGCCDNTRSDAPFYYANYYAGLGTYPYANDDNILNPYFGTFQYTQAYPGYFSRGSIQDYPTAVLLKLPNDAFFAVAAVTNSGIAVPPVDRGNNFDPNDTSTWTGPCNANTPGTNDAACDNAQGAWFFSTITTGSPNAIPSEAGKNNVIPWQVPPVPTFDPNADVNPDPNDPNRVIVDLTWPAIFFHHDGRSVPSNHPTMNAVNPAQPGDPNAASGVGVPDILAKFGLARYQIQVAADNDPAFTTVTQTITCPGHPACTGATSAQLNVDLAECARVRTLLGTPPRESVASAASCRLGMCGDLGIFVNGARVCFRPCVPEPGGEQCNGLDDDCDELVDEDFNIGQACNGIGECGQGTLECLNPTTAICSSEPGGSDSDPNDPRWDPNNPFPGPTPEFCEGLDNDCDTLTDEDFVLGGTCTGVGECANDPNGNPLPGSVECHATDPNTTQCSTDPGGTLDQSDPETCDTLDNDCDAQTDEDFSLGMACDGEGPCGTGVFECDPNSVGAICSTEPGGSGDQSQPETCDALDNDCDASTDEDFNVGQTCDGEGECGTGVIECSGPSSSICSTEPGGSADDSDPEFCDALDNDCDASTDEDFSLGQTCDGEGECGAGVRECNPADPNDMDFCSTDAGGSADESATEACANGLDEDCDGQTDELGASEVCDGFDNNCDNQVDEGFNVGQVCDGVGECGAGLIECDPNNIGAICSTEPGGSQDQSTIERCEGVDNDCDGQTDEGFSLGQSCNGTGACKFDPNDPDPNSLPSPGVIECNPADANTIVCSTNPGGSQDRSVPEICSNSTGERDDDDCDGIRDNLEGFNVGFECDPPGECGSGRLECDTLINPANPTFSVCSTAPGGSEADPNNIGDPSYMGPRPEICDGLDNDCNTLVDDGSANQPQDCEVYDPPTLATLPLTTVDCSNPRAIQHRMRWHTRSFDVFRPQISWDPNFSTKKQLIQSYVNLTTDFWEPNGRQWKKACTKAMLIDPTNPVLYFRVLRKDLDLPRGDPGREDTTPVVVAEVDVGRADLSITKSDGQSEYTPGATLVYTIVVANDGPDDVFGATVTDTFPAAFTSVTWTCTPSGSGSCTTLGSGNISEAVDIPLGESVTFIVSAMVDGAATGDIVNTASVAVPAGKTDPDPSNNSATDTDIGQSDLSITKDDGQIIYSPGGFLTYTLVVSNLGPDHVVGATVIDTFPAVLTSVTWTCVPSGAGSCSNPDGSGDINEVVDIPAGESVTFTIDAMVDGAATGDIVNTATVATPAGKTDPDTGNNSATDTDTDMGQSDISISKDDGQSTYSPGGSLTYTLIVSNLGPDDVVGAMVTDTFPSALTSVTWTCVPSGAGSCTASGAGDISEAVDIPAGESVTFTIDAMVDGAATGDLVNTASVAPPAGWTDPDTGNNSATDTDTEMP